MSSGINNNLIIPVQPKQNFHFRYVTELNSSHGFLTGQPEMNKTPNADVVYPTVRLLLPQNGHLDDNKNTKEFYVLCTLHNYDVKCLSPHVLMAKENVSINYEFIFQKMHEDTLNPLERFWELQEYIIVRLTKNQFKTALESKCREYQKLNLPMNFEAIKGNVNLTDNNSVKKSASLNVCLGFTIFEKINDTFRLYKETIYSDNIYHGDDLNIHRLCNKHGSIYGGKKITILINVNSNLPLTVLITKINDKTKETEWSKEVTIDNTDIYGNHAITFILPPYDGPLCGGDDITVDMEVVVTGTTYKSNNEKFHYINDNTPRKNARKFRKITQDEEVVSTPSTVLLDMDNNTIVANSNMGIGLLTESNTNLNMEIGLVTEANINANPNMEIGIVTTSNVNPNMEIAIATNENIENLWTPGQDMDELMVNYTNSNNANMIDLWSFGQDMFELTNILGTNDFGNEPFYENLNNLLPSNNQSVSRDCIMPILKKVITQSVSTKKIKILSSAQSEYSLHKMKTKIDEILKMPKDKTNIDITGLSAIDGNTIFHEALATSYYFMYFYKLANNSPQKNIVLNARNKYRENLLHYSCRYNRADCIRPLIGMGCRLNEQDIEGRTPLHTAMEFNHNDCILKIQQLLEDHSKYPKEVAENLVNMFKVYNRRGNTVLHEAIIDNRKELLLIMLKFCRKYNINVRECNVLRNGNSILNSIVHLIALVKYIRRYVPYNVKIENYFLKFIVLYWHWMYRFHQRKCCRHSKSSSLIDVLNIKSKNS